RGFFVGKAKLFGFGPKLDYVCRSDSRSDDTDGGVHVVAAAFVSVDHCRGGAADGEGPIVAGTIAVIAVQDIEKRRITGTKHAVGVHMRVRTAALTGDRVDAFNMFRAEIVKNFAHHSDAFVFFHSWFHEAIELV